jgi:spore germination protein YaaH
LIVSSFGVHARARVRARPSGQRIATVICQLIATMSVSLLAGLACAAAPCPPAWADAVAASTAQAAAQPSLQAFVLAGAPDSLSDLEAHGQEVGVVYPTFFACAAGTGRIAEEGGEATVGRSMASIDAYAKAHGIEVMPRFDCQDGRTVHLILTDPVVRARVLAGLVRIAEVPADAGVNLDFENDGPHDRAALSSFVRTLADTLHRDGRKLSVDVDGVAKEDASIGTGFYDDRALAQAVDYVFVMAWGTHWEGSSPGPIAPISYVAAVARYLASLPNAGRFVLGVPMYGLDWPVPEGGSSPAGGRRAGRASASALRYANIVALARSVGADPLQDLTVDEPTFSYRHDGVEHKVWYMNAESIADRLRIAKTYGLQAGLWRLGGEDQTLWASPFA